MQPALFRQLRPKPSTLKVPEPPQGSFGTGYNLLKGLGFRV